MEPVVITSMGVVSALGLGLRAFEAGLRAGVGGIRAVDLPFAAADAGAQVPDLPVDPALPRALALLFAAADEAVAGLTSAEIAEAGVLLGTAQGAADLLLTLHEGEAPPPITALGLPGAGALALAARLGARGGGATVGMACVSSAAAVWVAARRIARGDVPRVIAGGFEAHLAFVWRGFQAMGVTSRAPCRPLDRRRDGLNLGEGAAILVLESAAAAHAAGRRALATVLGGSLGAEARHLAAPDPAGAVLARCIREALDEAGVPAGAVGHVNAHATATLRGDEAELAALGAALGDAPPPVSAIKGAVGHTLGAAGALELAASVLALDGGFLPATVGLEAPMTGPPWDLVPAPRLAPGLGTALACFSAFGGSVGAVVLGRGAACAGGASGLGGRAVRVGAAAWATGSARGSWGRGAGPRGAPGLSPRQRRQLDEASALAVRLADGVAGGLPDGSTPHRVGVCLGLAAGCLAANAAWEGDPQAPPWRFQATVANAPAAWAGIALGLIGPSLSFTSAGDAGADAVLEAVHLLAEGRADGVLAGGVDVWPPLPGLSRPEDAGAMLALGTGDGLGARILGWGRISGEGAEEAIEALGRRFGIDGPARAVVVPVAPDPLGASWEEPILRDPVHPPVTGGVALPLAVGLALDGLRPGARAVAISLGSGGGAWVALEG